MGKFDRMLFCTDLDGTLLKNDKTISDENIEAIRTFKKEGGVFTFITGRMPWLVEHICDRLELDVPYGCVNGGGIYDLKTREYIWKNPIRSDYLELIRCVDERFSEVGIQVNTFYKPYFCKETESLKEFVRLTGELSCFCHYSQVQEEIAKILFVAENEADIVRLDRVLSEHPLADNFVLLRCDETLFEILPKNTSKGVSLMKLTEYFGLSAERTVVIGDYDNDASMLRAAKLGIAVSNASEAALRAADLITVSNEENAVAKVIESLYCGEYRL